MRTEIYLENNLLDVTEDLSNQFTYAIDDIKDFSSRNTSFSKTIVIQGTANNNKLFGHIYNFGESNNYDFNSKNVGYNFNPMVSAQCLIYYDKIQIFKGVLRLLEIIITDGSIEYECAVFGELGGFISSIGNKKLEDLDFSSYNHIWNATNILNSWASINGVGYYYPLIDYGQVSTDKIAFDVRAFRPAFYVREMMTKIIADAGYTYTSAFFDTAFFKRLIIPNNQKDLYKTSNTGVEAYITTNQMVIDGTIPQNSAYLQFNTPILSNFTSASLNSQFTYTGASPVTITPNIIINGYIYNSTFDVKVRLYKNLTIIYEQVYTPRVFDNIIFNYTTPITFATGDYLRLQIFTSASASTTYVEVSDATLILNYATVQIASANYGDTLLMNAIIPKGIFQRDFFSSIMKMFNLYIVEDATKTKHLNIIPFIDYYTTTFIDWKDKVDRSKPLKIKPMSELNGRYFEFNYKSDVDFNNEQYSKKYSKNYGSRIEDTGYEFTGDKQSCEIIFSGSPIVGYAGKDKYFTAIYKLSNNNSVEDKTESNIRILQAKSLSCTSWALKNGATTLATYVTYGYAGHLDDPLNSTADLNFGAPEETYFNVSNYTSANIFNAYWSEYIYEITDKDSKLLTCYIYLKPSDILNLNFANMIYIDGVLWRLNKVEDYNPADGMTKVQLLKVIDLIY